MWSEMFTIIFNMVSVVQTANEETKEHLYETLLAECRDTIQAVREELKNETVRCIRVKSWHFLNEGGCEVFYDLEVC